MKPCLRHIKCILTKKQKTKTKKKNNKKNSNANSFAAIPMKQNINLILNCILFLAVLSMLPQEMFIYASPLLLQVFPQALAYNRLTGAFDKVERLERMTSLPSIIPSLQYGPTDAERDNLLEWAREERLPLFLRYVAYIHSLK